MYKVYVDSRIKEVVLVDANSYEEAIEAYYNGDYQMTEEIDRDVLDTNAEEVKE